MDLSPTHSVITSSATEARTIKALAARCGCAVTETIRGRWWWKERALTISGDEYAMAAFQTGLAELEREALWSWAIR